jgi:hypothetical protein
MPGCLFWRKVLRRPPYDITAHRVNGRQGAGNAEIGYFQAAVWGDQHIVRFDIAVNQPGAVRVADAFARLRQQVNASSSGNFPRCLIIVFRSVPGHKFHHDKQPPGIEAKIMHRDDIGVR